VSSSLVSICAKIDFRYLLILRVFGLLGNISLDHFFHTAGVTHSSSAKSSESVSRKKSTELFWSQNFGKFMLFCCSAILIDLYNF
jgi:hypothetical protein